MYTKLGFFAADLKQVASSIPSQVPAARFGSAGEIASAVVFLASDDSAYPVAAEAQIDGRVGNI